MQNRIISFLILLLTGLFAPTSYAAASDFTVVIDPGHGGKDSGTLGSSVKEKDIVLAVGLKFGRLIQDRFSDVRVIYTRSSDVFIPLDQRANIANKAKANLFISVHADHAESPTVRGASTFTLGQNRSNENFEIAKRENAVILLEDNYKQRYEGFDPNSAESYIMFEFMQDNYMNQSIQFASTLQDKFTASGRRDRGVRQDVFLVLRRTSMPSVLVELGFLSNFEEEKFLKSDAGQEQMAEALLRGFTDFKNNYERKSTGNHVSSKKNNTDSVSREERSSRKETQNSDSAENSKKLKELVNETTARKEDKPSSESLVFKVQIKTSPTKLAENSRQLKGCQAEYFVEKNTYKYTVGNFSSFNEANKLRRELRSKFPDAFVIAFKNGEKIPIDEARAQTKH